MGCHVESLARQLPLIKSELHRRVTNCVPSIAVVLEEMFVQLFGPDRPRAERVAFLFFVAPIARRLAVERIPDTQRLGATDITVADARICLQWLDLMDPVCAQMVDLRYCGGLGIKETAAALGMRPPAVLRMLRFVKEWLKIKLPE